VVDTPYRYTGQREESGIGLYYYNARWYDASVGRFIQPDTIVPEPSNPQSLNRYAYVLNNPVRYTDPSGLANERGVGGSIGDPPVARGSAIVSLLGPTIKTQAQRYGVPWQVVAGVLGAEVALDTDVWDYGESAFFLTAPPLAWTGNRAAYGALEAFLWLKPDPGPGVGNVHLSTARAVSAYYGEDPVTGLGMHELRAEWLAFQLSCPSRNVAAVAAYVGMLADYRFGSGGAPGRADHSDLATWSLTDAVAVWHGYRYGVQDVSPDGAAGYRLDRFQQRSTDMATTVNLAGGDDKIRSMYGAVPYIRQYWR
jgi:RHS repeat-associated protein